MWCDLVEKMCPLLQVYLIYSYYKCKYPGSSSIVVRLRIWLWYFNCTSCWLSTWIGSWWLSSWPLFLSSHLSCFLACKISSVSLHLLRKYPASGFFEGLMSPITLWLELQQHCWSQLSVSLGWTYDFRKLFIERRICYFLSMLTCMWRCSWTVEFRVLTVIVAIMKHVKLAFWK